MRILLPSTSPPGGRIRVWNFLWLMLLFSALLTGCQSEPEKPAAPAEELSSHERMQALLAQVAKDAESENRYFQSASLKHRLAQLSLTRNPWDQLRLNLEISDDYLRLGNNAEATRHIEAALSVVDRHKLKMQKQGYELLLFRAGVSFLRLGETENCVNCRTGESCILPIAEGGRHQKTEGSRRAAEYFLRVLDSNPDHLEARWLLNIAKMTLGEYPAGVPEKFRVPEERFTDHPFPRFSDVSRERGINTFNTGGGAVAEDFDNDGDFDLVTSTWDPGGAMHYFENDGSGKFQDRTANKGLADITGGINMVQADYDNDGDIDVFVLRGAWLAKAGHYPNSLLQNNGKGKFTDVSLDVGFQEPFHPSSSAAWLDYDNDGDLDLFVANEQAPCQLFQNDGAAGFHDVAIDAGVTNGGFTKGVTAGDINGDGFPDIYHSNLDGNNRLYINNGNKTFTDQAAELGVENPQVSFPTWFWDVNNDGLLDLYVASYQTGVSFIAAEFAGVDHSDERDRLYLGQPGGGFVESGKEFGLTGATQPMGSNFGDLDNDGFLDFYLGTGYPEYEGLMPNLMFHNNGGRKFEPVSFSGGFAHLQKGHGTAFCDFDNDGDQDVFMQMGGAYPGDAFGDVLYENPGFGNNWIRVKAIGTTSNRSSIGARIKVTIRDEGQTREIYRWVNSGGSFGAHSLQQHIGIGGSAQVESVEIHWPTTGRTKIVTNPKINAVLEVTEPEVGD